jgi:hypothetical protein
MFYELQIPQNRRRHMKVVFMLQVGKSITENIVDCMDSSRKFLVILTKSYLLRYPAFLNF